MRFREHVAIVTGSSRNIGRSIARRLAAEGAAVLLHGVSPAEVAPALEELRAAGGRAAAISGDLSRPEAAEELVAAALREFGRLDILVNNAAVTALVRPFLELTPALIAEVLGVNLGGALLCSLYAARAMAARGGCIVNISSGGAVRAHRQMVAYDASKGGLDAATRALALDLAPHGIRVNGVRPALVRTDRWEGVGADELGRRRAGVPLGREAEPEEIAAVVAFLCSAEAAYITGETIAVDGGLLAQLRTREAELVTPAAHLRNGRHEEES